LDFSRPTCPLAGSWFELWQGPVDNNETHSFGSNAEILAVAIHGESDIMDSVIATNIDEFIVFNTVEHQTIELINAWSEFLSNVPVPALWVTAHVQGSTPKKRFQPLHELRINIAKSHARDTKALHYRTFLQKFLTRVNKKALKSKTWSKAFAFRGVVEPNCSDTTGSQLHFHFLLWEPGGRFACEPELMNETARCLTELWVALVNAADTKHSKPIDIEIVTNKDQAKRIADYEHKRKCLSESCELFDDWSMSIKLPEQLELYLQGRTESCNGAQGIA